MKKLITPRKAKWVAQFKPKIIVGSPLNPNISDAVRYNQRLDKLIKAMVDDVEKQVLKLFKSSTAKEFFAQDASVSSQARILTNGLMSYFSDFFAKSSKHISEKVVSDANKSSSTSLRLSLKELSGGLTIKTDTISESLIDIMSASVSENVSLIKSIPTKYLNGIQGAVMRSITTGNGLADLLPYMEKHRQITFRRAKMIAYDQTRKAYSSINYERMDRLGMKEFKWLHSGGSNHPRQEHVAMSGNIYSIDNPPIIDKATGERGLPGQLINCRCKAIPVIKFEE